MPIFLSRLRAPLKLLDNPIIANNFNTTTWLIIGALTFQLLTLILTSRIATLFALAVLFAKVVPTTLVATGKNPNEELSTVIPGKSAALFPKADGSSGTPGGHGLALLIIGLKISHPLGIFAPGAKETGDLFSSLVEDLNEHRGENGWLGGSAARGNENGHVFLIGYFKSMDDLHAFAHAPHHREAWNWWNKNVKNMPHIGVYHEAYDIPAHHWEAVYIQTPKMGLGKSEVRLDDGTWESVIHDARKGVWRSSAGRMGREEGKTYDDDPYNNE